MEGLLRCLLDQYSLPAVAHFLFDSHYKLGFPVYDCLNAFLTAWEIRKRAPNARLWESISLAVLSMISGSIIIGNQLN